MLADSATQQAEATTPPTTRPVGIPTDSEPYRPEKVEEPAPEPKSEAADSKAHATAAKPAAAKASHASSPAKAHAKPAGAHH